MSIPRDVALPVGTTLYRALMLPSPQEMRARVVESKQDAVVLETGFPSYLIHAYRCELAFPQSPWRTTKQSSDAVERAIEIGMNPRAHSEADISEVLGLLIFENERLLRSDA